MQFVGAANVVHCPLYSMKLAIMKIKNAREKFIKRNLLENLLKRNLMLFVSISFIVFYCSLKLEYKLQINVKCPSQKAKFCYYVHLCVIFYLPLLSMYYFVN